MAVRDVVAPASQPEPASHLNSAMRDVNLSQGVSKCLKVSAIRERPAQRYSEVFGLGAEGQGFVVVLDFISRLASLLLMWKTATPVM